MVVFVEWKFSLFCFNGSTLLGHLTIFKNICYNECPGEGASKTKQNKKHPVFLSRTLQQYVCVLTIVVRTCSHYSCGHVVTVVTVFCQTVTDCSGSGFGPGLSSFSTNSFLDLCLASPSWLILSHTRTHTPHTDTHKHNDSENHRLKPSHTYKHTHMHILNWPLDRVKLSTFLPGMLTPWQDLWGGSGTGSILLFQLLWIVTPSSQSHRPNTHSAKYFSRTTCKISGFWNPTQMDVYYYFSGSVKFTAWCTVRFILKGLTAVQISPVCRLLKIWNC